MADLPDRYGDLSNPNHIATNNLVVTVGIITGACGVAVMGSSLVLKTSDFNDFANFALAVLNQEPFVVYLTAGSLILGFLGIVVGMILSVSGLYVSRYPSLPKISVALLLLLGVLNIIGGALVQEGSSFIDNAIYGGTASGCSPSASPTSNPTSNSASFLEEAIIFQLAMFNQCCGSRGHNYSNEFYIPAPNSFQPSTDEDGTVKFCESLSSSDCNSISSQRRRSCYSNQEIYRDYNYTVTLNGPRICSTFEQATVNIAGRLIPGTSVDVTALTNNQAIIPLVAPIKEYGCGVGYAEAFQAAMLIWAENIIDPVGDAFLGCGVVDILLCLVCCAAFYCCSTSGNIETAEEKYARFMEEIQKSSEKNNQVANNDLFELGNPNRRSLPNTDANRYSVGGGVVDSNRYSVGGGVGGTNRNSLSAAGSNRMSVQNSNRISAQSTSTPGSGNSQNQQQIPVAQFAFNVDDKI